MQYFMSIVLGIPKCILIVLSLLSMSRLAILLNVVSSSYNIDFPPLLLSCIGLSLLLFSSSIQLLSISLSGNSILVVICDMYTFSELVSF